MCGWCCGTKVSGDSSPSVRCVSVMPSLENDGGCRLSFGPFCATESRSATAMPGPSCPHNRDLPVCPVPSLWRKGVTWPLKKRHPKQKLRRHVPNVRNKNPAWGALDSCLRPRDSAGIAHLPDRAFSLGERRLIDARSRPRHQLVRRDAACAQDLSLAWSDWGSNIHLDISYAFRPSTQ